MKTLTIQRHYDFSVYANSVLGATFKNARLSAILEYQTALPHSNIPLQHRLIYPYLPEGTPSDPTKYTYYKFVLPNGQEEVIADVWIRDESIVESSSVDQTLVLHNVTSGQTAIVRDQLRLLGVSFTFV